MTSSDLEQGGEGSVSHGMPSDDFNPTQNQAALQGGPSPTRFGKYKNPKSPLKTPGVSVLVKNHGVSNSPGFSWRTEKSWKSHHMDNLRVTISTCL